MGNITLNKPSGGQLTLSPEDGTSTETVTIPSVGVGKVLQTVTSSGSSYTATTSNTYLDIGGMAVTITPTSASSKFLVLFDVHLYAQNPTSTGSIWLGATHRIMRDGTEIIGDPANGRYGEALWTESSSQRFMANVSMHVWDSPNTTSPVTYKLQGAGLYDTIQTEVQWCRSNYGSGGTFTVMEVAA